MNLKEKQITHDLVYKNLFMKIYLDEILLPNNTTSKRIYLKHDGAAAVLPITMDGKVILIKQFRYPIMKEIIEIPAGKKDDISESGLVCAKRELEEETGYVSNDFSKFQDLHSCVGYSSELIELFVARNCVKIENPRKGDDDEFIELFIVSKDEIEELLRLGKVSDAKTLVALQHYLLNITK